MRKYNNTFNPYRIKINVSYSVPEIARLLGKHKGTVLLWHKKEGLKAIDDHPPYLFHGTELRRFIQERQAKRKQKCASNELFCFKCREPRTSVNNQVLVIIMNQRQLVIKGYCSVCNSRINRTDAVRNLTKLTKVYCIAEIQGKHLLGYVSPNVINDFKGETTNEGILPRTEQVEPGK